MINKGKEVEYEIIEHINKYKYIDKMNTNISNFLQSIFDFDLSNTEISAKKYYSNYKPDIVITANETKKYISIKSGNNNSIHQEHIHSFCEFLRRKGTKQNILNKILFFHYNDGSIDNSGSNRKSAKEFYEDHPVIAAEINTFLNNEILNSLIERILFKGEYSNIPSVDYIYHGDLNDGLWASKENILDFLIKNKPTTLAIHVSKLYYQSLQRNKFFSLKDEYRRYYIQFKWYSLKADLEFISNEKNK